MKYTMRFELEPFHRDIPDNLLIADLRRVVLEAGTRTVTIDQYNERGKFHATTLTRRFGSWFRALEKAQLPKTRNLNIPSDDLFQNLVEVWTQLGHQPRYDEMKKGLSLYSSGTYENRFGTWRRALEAFVSWANEGVVTENIQQPPNRDQRAPRTANWRQRAIVLMRDGAKCRLCGATPQTGSRLHVDHVVPWNKGGETTVENLQILCEMCNIGKSDLEG